MSYLSGNVGRSCSYSSLPNAATMGTSERLRMAFSTVP